MEYQQKNPLKYYALPSLFQTMPVILYQNEFLLWEKGK
jgi:hypothetical protein